MNHLPTGTVTFLFTDIQGSTDLAQKFPDALPALLARHHAILRDAIETYHGVVFRIAGDSFSAAFDTASDALNAALDAQRKLNAEDWQPAPIRVRMGINTGDAHAKGLDSLGSAYEGYSTLARVARVMALAHGGQILLANSTSELVRDALPANVTLRDMGEHQLKGLIQRERLWQVVTPDLPQDFPPLPTFQLAPSNLPVRLNRLIGRARELEQIKLRLGETRLLTLLGPGGTGKTSLALQAAAELRGEFQDAVYFVDLAASRDTGAALAAIARALGVREEHDASLLDAIKKHIKDSKMLLLLDNFEQVTIAAPTIAELVRGCSELHALVTSREALRVRGEVVLPIPPLAVPAPELRKQSFEAIAQSEAVQLFVERARAVKPDFELTRENAQVVAEICARLDGLPLAIELATARLNVFTPQTLAERLSRHLNGSSNRLKLLRGGARDLPARQQTLSGAIEWSYEMLDADEQKLFALLAVFSGATFEAVEAVTNQIETLNALDVFDVVGSLVNKSLLRQTETLAGAARLQMLETIREFAAARLDENAELRADARRAHARYFADYTKSEWANLTGEGRDAALERLTADLENIKAAWQYWAAEGDLEQLRKLTDSLWYLYDARGWYHASIELINDLLKILATTVSTPERLREEILLQTTLARAIQSTKGYTIEVEQAYQRALELCDRAGEIPELFPVLRGLASFYVLRMEEEKSVAMAERIIRLAERLDDRDMLVEGQMVLGYSLGSLDNLKAGLEHLEKAIALYDLKRQRVRRLGLGANEGVLALNAAAMYAWILGFPERARKRSGESVGLARKLDHPFSVCYAIFHYGLLSFWLGYPQVAHDQTRALADIAAAHEFQIWSAVGACVHGAALTQLGSGDIGIPMIEDGITAYGNLKTPPVFLPMLRGLQAEAYRVAGRPEDGLKCVGEAIQLGTKSSGKAFAPEFLGIAGELYAAVGNFTLAHELLHQAVHIAQEVQTPMLELRAAVKLSRLWQQQGKSENARTVLQSAYAKLTEGFEMPDLAQARALLQELE
jgi:predicted ATPase/class 3 adenylate cyclase